MTDFGSIRRICSINKSTRHKAKQELNYKKKLIKIVFKFHLEQHLLLIH